MSFDELHKMGEALRKLLMLPTYPLAVKFYEDSAEFPDKTRQPRDWGRKWAMCQAWTLSRTIGWTIGLTPRDSICTPCNVLFGWAEVESERDFVDTWLEMGIAGSEDGVKRFLKEHCWLKRGEYKGIVFSPLQWTKVVPDIVFIYCNPAQAGVLIPAFVYKEGRSFSSTFRSSAACASCIIGTLNADSPNIIIPCAGERGQAMSNDSELIFSFPGGLLEDMVNGLETNRRYGYNRIPIVPNLLFEPDLIPPYARLEKKLKTID